MTEQEKAYHAALSQCAELLDNMKDGDPITDTPRYLAAKLNAQSVQVPEAEVRAQALDQPAMYLSDDEMDAAHDAIDIAQSSTADKASEVRAAEWISVEDERKPEERKPVLLFVRTLTRGEDDDGRPYETEGEQVEMGEYRFNNGSPYFSCFVSPMSDNDWVTHWMPLPAAPSTADSGNTVKGQNNG